MNSESTRRIFLGIPVSEEIKEKVKEIQEELRKIEGGFKIVKPENLHLTLKFMGEVREEKIKKVKEILGNLDLGKKFQVKVRKVGAFPNENYAGVIWFGLEDGEKIFELHKMVDFGLSKLFSVEKDFLAHVTLSRVKFVKDKEGLKNFLGKFKDVELGGIVVDKIVLYESRLKKEGPEYKVVEEYGLG